jgi:hypothetical protein
MVAVAVALAALCGLIGVLASRQPATAMAEASTPGEWEGNWYWKDGGWIDYAPSGVPDVDQKQICWGPGGPPSPPCPLPQPAQWTYCGPAAAANSLWWFDSKFEPSPASPLLGPNDNYYLVTAYPGSADDHDPPNWGGESFPPTPWPPGLVDDLAWYFDTNGQRTGAVINGTEVHAMSYGLQWYLYGDTPKTWGLPPYGPGYGYRYVSYYDDYHVQLVKKPTWDWVVEEVLRSEDVILLLGFWQESG